MLLVNAVNTEGRPLEIFVKDGRIAAVGQELEALAGENETVIDAGGLTVLPAFVDLHCHWRTPGFEYKEDIETGSRAAAAGGYTFVNLMPMGPTMISALRQFTTTAFSPVAARGAPALRMAFAARLLVPTAVSRTSGHCVLRAATSCLPRPPPCPSMTSTFIGCIRSRSPQGAAAR